MVTKKVKNLLANSGKKTKTKTKTINLAYTCIPNTIFCCLRQSIWFSSPSGCHFLLLHWKPAFAKAYVTTDLHRQNPLCSVVSTAMGELGWLYRQCTIHCTRLPSTPSGVMEAY